MTAKSANLKWSRNIVDLQYHWIWSDCLFLVPVSRVSAWKHWATAKVPSLCPLCLFTFCMGFKDYRYQLRLQLGSMEDFNRPFKSVYKYRKQCKKMAWDFGRDPVCGQENLDQTQCMNGVENSYRPRLPVLGLADLLPE